MTGIYINKKTSFNPKCVYFSFAVIAFYWYNNPAPNLYLVPLIFVFAYVAMSWYDLAYDCDDKLKSGNSPLGLAAVDSIFKPQYKNSKKGPRSKDLVPPNEQTRLFQRNVYLFHIIYVGPILLYFGLYPPTDPRAYTFLAALGLLALLYHAARFFQLEESLSEHLSLLDLQEQRRKTQQQFLKENYTSTNQKLHNLQDARRKTRQQFLDENFCGACG